MSGDYEGVNVLLSKAEDHTTIGAETYSAQEVAAACMCGWTVRNLESDVGRECGDCGEQRSLNSQILTKLKIKSAINDSIEGGN